jgi:hypothetical protein
MCHDAKSHYFGKVHRKQIGRFMTNLGLAPPTRKSEDIPESLTQLRPDENPKFCSVCNISHQSTVMAISHYSGKQHKKRKRQQRNDVQAKLHHRVHQTTPGSMVKQPASFGEGAESRVSCCVPCQVNNVKTRPFLKESSMVLFFH